MRKSVKSVKYIYSLNADCDSSLMHGPMPVGSFLLGDRQTSLPVHTMKVLPRMAERLESFVCKEVGLLRFAPACEPLLASLPTSVRRLSSQSPGSIRCFAGLSSGSMETQKRLIHRSKKMRRFRIATLALALAAALVTSLAQAESPYPGCWPCTSDRGKQLGGLAQTLRW